MLSRLNILIYGEVLYDEIVEILFSIKFIILSWSPVFCEKALNIKL